MGQEDWFDTELQKDIPEVDKLEFCETCGKNLIDLIMGKAAEQVSDPEPKKAETKKTETKKATPKKEEPKKKELDIPKVRALRAAGWTYAKIADELGVSQTRIFNVLNE